MPGQVGSELITPQLNAVWVLVRIGQGALSQRQLFALLAGI